jgi:hypothetical protein
VARAASVEEYIAALPEPLREVAAATRAIVDERLPDATSAIRWAHPTWSVGREPVCYLKGASRHVTFGFWRGASIEDPSGRLETSGSVMAHAKLRTPGDVDAELFGDWLRQARALVGPADP